MKTLDLEATYAALAPDQVKRLCMAAIALEVAVRNKNADGAATPQANWGTIQDAAWDAIDQVMEAAGIDGCLAVPDMNALGVRTCKGCGCTDDRACPGGCWWVAEATCSSCGGNALTSAAGAEGTASFPHAGESRAFGDHANGRPWLELH